MAVHVFHLCESIINVFGKNPLDDENVDEVVALGAALYAAYKSGGANLNSAQKQSISNINLQEVSNYCFGTLTGTIDSDTGERVSKNFTVISKNTKIPTTHTKKFQTSIDGQTGVKCEVTQSTHEESDPNYVKIIWVEVGFSLPLKHPQNSVLIITLLQ